MKYTKAEDVVAAAKKRINEDYFGSRTVVYLKTGRAIDGWLVEMDPNVRGFFGPVVILTNGQGDHILPLSSIDFVVYKVKEAYGNIVD